MTEPVGTFRAYETWKPTEETLVLLGRASEVLSAAEAKGFVMTLRGLHYALLGPDYPNTQRSYDRLKAIVSRGRLAGYISWTAIEDVGRYLRGLSTEESPVGALKNLAATYRRDLWADQEWRPEVWIEKDAGLATVASICNKLRINYFACRGYNSQSEQWKAGQRFADYIRRGQRPIVFHVGDHDYSGLDMTRDIRERVETFAGVPVLVQRLALNIGQVEELRLPPNPGKSDDSRKGDYIERFGTDTWELDALTPEYIMKLIEDAIAHIRHEPTWEDSLTREVEEIEQLRTLAEDGAALSEPDRDEEDEG